MYFLDFLDAKPLYYDEIDYGRMPRVWEKVRHAFTLPKIVHVVGTNGKGTTGRFLAQALRSAGHRVGHYTSPHILRFNERIWIDGAEASDALLQQAFETVLARLDGADAAALSYFEFTTLMAAAAFEGCDYAVMEAGLGGEHDATAVFDKALSLFTPIGIDHQAFLGEDVETIARTKLRAMGPEAIIGVQRHAEVCAAAEAIGREKDARLLRLHDVLDENAIIRLQKISKTLRLADYMADNLMLAAAALQRLGIAWNAASFGTPPFGRLTRIAPNVLLDVGHNVPAAEAIAAALGRRTFTLVYGSYGDKDYAGVLRALAPVVASVELIEIEAERAASQASLEAALHAAGLPFRAFDRLDEKKNYLVFGSFAVAEAFLRKTGLQAPSGEE